MVADGEELSIIFCDAQVASQIGELVTDWQICHGWSRIIRLALIGRLASDWCIGGGLADLYWIGV